MKRSPVCNSLSFSKLAACSLRLTAAYGDTEDTDLNEYENYLFWKLYINSTYSEWQVWLYEIEFNYVSHGTYINYIIEHIQHTLSLLKYFNCLHLRQSFEINDSI